MVTIQRKGSMIKNGDGGMSIFGDDGNNYGFEVLQPLPDKTISTIIAT